MDWLNS